MSANEKGSGMGEKAKNVEKLTDESLDKVSGGFCYPIDCQPKVTPVCCPGGDPGWCDPKCNPHKCKPMR